MQVGQNKFGMQTLNQALLDLYQRRIITLEDAQNRSTELEEFNMMLETRTAKGALVGRPLPRS
jgi:twitching motility protein PilT